MTQMVHDSYLPTVEMVQHINKNKYQLNYKNNKKDNWKLEISNSAILSGSWTI